MKCPVCDVNLVMSERQGIEIDYCPECRGVWLDRGELDKIIERSKDYESNHGSSNNHNDRDRRDDHHYDKHDRSDDRSYHKPHKKQKMSSFLGDIFEQIGG